MKRTKLKAVKVSSEGRADGVVALDGALLDVSSYIVHVSFISHYVSCRLEWIHG